MGIGTSLGAYFEDSMHMAADPFLIKPAGKADEIMEISPQAMQENKKAESAETNEFGPGLEANVQEGMRPADVALAGMKSTMPFPDNRNRDSEFNSRFGTLPPAGILNDLKKPSVDPTPMVRKIDYKTASPLVNITDEDIDKATGIALSFSGGGLSTTEGKVLQYRPKGANDNIPDKPMYNASKVDQLARKLGEAENGGRWDTLGGAGQEHYYKDARKALRNDPAARDVPSAYNPKEPDMIGSDAMDAHIDHTWQLFKDSQEKAGQAEMLLRKKDFTEFDAARVKKLQKEAADAIRKHNDLLNQ